MVNFTEIKKVWITLLIVRTDVMSGIRDLLRLIERISEMYSSGEGLVCLLAFGMLEC